MYYYHTHLVSWFRCTLYDSIQVSIYFLIVAIKSTGGVVVCGEWVTLECFNNICLTK